MPTTDVTEWTVPLPDERATARLAEDIATILRPGDVVRLSGTLGAGKTSFARALIRALAADPALDVPSPTFPIRIDYSFPRLSLSHIDLYRLSDDSELDELGLDEAVAAGALVVEWPERLPPEIGVAEFLVALRMDASGRQAIFSASGIAAERLARSFAVRSFLDGAGREGASRIPMVGDASVRAYERIHEDGATSILMNAPARPEGPAIYNGRSYDAIAHRALDVFPFLAIGDLLKRQGIRVPELRAHDAGAGLLLLEDLGTAGILDDQGDAILGRYEAAIDLLAAMHGKTWPAEASFEGQHYPIPAYDRGALLIEISLFPQWIGGAEFTPEARAAFCGEWERVLQQVPEDQRTLVLRDFHSPNILWLENAAGHARVGVIDFQDALIGHPAYDVASLAQDARVAITQAEEGALKARYVAARKDADSAFDEAAFDLAYTILGAQRATKVLGAFHRLAVVEGKTGYQRHMQRVKDVLARNLSHPVLSSLRVWYEPYVA